MRVQEKNLIREFLWKTAVLIGVAYVFLSTFLWHLLWSAVIWLAWESTQLGKAENERDYFLTYATKTPALNAMCNFGNLVIDSFQPMISDETLIAHWQKHREGMERVALMTALKQRDYSDFSKPNLVKELQTVGVSRLFVGEDIASFELYPKPSQEHQNYFCGHGAYRKRLVFYTGTYIPIEINGRLLTEPNPPFPLGILGMTLPGARLVSDANAISEHRNESLAKRLSERWYIWR